MWACIVLTNKIKTNYKQMRVKVNSRQPMQSESLSQAYSNFVPVLSPKGVLGDQIVSIYITSKTKLALPGFRLHSA